MLALTFESKDKTKRQRHIIQQLKMRYETVTVFLLNLFINTIQGPPWIAAFQSDNKSSLSSLLVKFIYSEKATKFCEISTLLLSYVVPVKGTLPVKMFGLGQKVLSHLA